MGTLSLPACIGLGISSKEVKVLYIALFCDHAWAVSSILHYMKNQNKLSQSIPHAALQKNKSPMYNLWSASSQIDLYTPALFIVGMPIKVEKLRKA